MKSVSPVLLKQKRMMDYMMLIICPAMAGVSIMIAILDQSGDIARLYAWNALAVELLLCFAPARSFIDRHGGLTRFGLVSISAMEWLFSIVMGVAVYCVFAALEGPLVEFFISLGMADTASYSAPTGWRFFASILLIGIIPALAEETLFHGALLFSWMPHGSRRAIWHSAALFALVQLNPAVFPLLLAVGLLFAHVSARAGSCYPAMAMYATNNILSLTLLRLAADKTLTLPDDPAIYMIVGGVLGIIAYIGLMRATKRRQSAVMEAAHKLYKAIRDTIYAGLSDEENGAIENEREGLLDEQNQRPGYIESDGILLMPGKIIVALTYIFLLLFNAMLMALLFAYS